MKRYSVFLGVVMLVASQLSWAQTLNFDSGEEWKVSYDKKGILLHTKKLEGEVIRAVKVATTIKASIESAIFAITNVDQMASWVPILESSELLQSTDNNGKSISYLITDLPWPIKNRDVLYENRTTYNEDKSEVYFYSSAFIDEELKSSHSSLVRMPSSQALWRVKAIGKNLVEVELTAHADPGGAIPKWFANLVIVQGPKMTILNLRKLLERESEEIAKKFDSKEVFGHDVKLTSLAN